MIRVLIVEDLLVVRQFLEHVLRSDPAIEVVGSARSGQEAIELVGLTRPHVITMDINMPGMDGLEATRRIMETLPTPIVVVSASWDAAEVGKTFQAMEAGAVAVLAKPSADGHASSVQAARDLIQTVKLMSEVKVVRRWARAGGVATRPPETDLGSRTGEIEVVGVGASTGGPVPIQTILRGIPRPFQAAVLIVQHMAAGFTRGFADWLGQSTGLIVQIGAQGQRMRAGQVYVAPEDQHMGVSEDGGLVLSGAPPECGMRPSVSHLLRAVARVHGGRAVGVLLSGMGTDGADGLKLMRDRGAVTFAQDEQSCAVWGMPGAAVKLDAAVHQLPPEGIAAVLADLLRAGDHGGMSRP